MIERFVVTPEPDGDSCRRYYDRNRDKFRTPTIYEAAHILLSVSRNENVAFEAKRRNAHAIISALREDPSRFAHLARAYSICPSSADGGNLGQLLPGDTTAEFERALASLQPGEITQAPVETRYGLHIIRLDRRIEGAELPFEPVKERIASYLRAATITQARALYVRMLVEQANIEGLELASHRTRTPRDNDAPLGALRT
ncbi:peptidylprolyl isomerase [Hyphomicrobium sp. 1Nfss2.1]|uniref:peptidylprolyl isomerase n=1 Tax=Hyphomicrobium sp. 1Nfss2.1 TaxID=3413936 RepID=UPI003C7D400B